MAYLGAEDLGEYLRMGSSWSSEATVLEMAIEAACQDIHAWCGIGRQFDKVETVDASARLFTTDDAWTVEVDDFWSTTGLVVKSDDDQDGVYETTWTAGTDFTLHPVNGRAYGQVWPYYRIRSTSTRHFACNDRRGSPQVQVTAAWGWPAVPAPVKLATLMQGARLFKRRGSPEGVLGWQDYGPVRVSSRPDPDVARLIRRYLRRSAAGASSVTVR